MFEFEVRGLTVDWAATDEGATLSAYANASVFLQQVSLVQLNL
jgi:hypothetical protein